MEEQNAQSRTATTLSPVKPPSVYATPVNSPEKGASVASGPGVFIEDPLNLDHVFFDLIDLHTYMYLHEPKHSRFDQLKHYLGQLKGKIMDYGRLYCRIQSVNIISTIAEAVDLLSASMHNFTIIKQTIPEIQKVRHSYMRKDANCYSIALDNNKAYILNYYDNSYYFKWVMEEEYKKIFLYDFDILPNYLDIVHYLYVLKDMNASDWPHADDYFNAVNKLPDDENNISIFSKQDLLSIFIFETDSTTNDTKKELKSELEIKEILSTTLKIDPMKHIFQPIQNLLIMWDNTALSLPRLAQLGYNRPFTLSPKQDDIEVSTEEKEEYDKIVTEATAGLHLNTPNERKRSSTGSNAKGKPKNKRQSKSAEKNNEDDLSTSSTDTETMDASNNDPMSMDPTTQQSEDITKKLIANPMKKTPRKKQASKKQKNTDMIHHNQADYESAVRSLHNHSQSLLTLSNDPLPEALNVARTAVATSSFTDMLTNTQTATTSAATTTTNKKKRKKPKTITSLEFGESGESEAEKEEPAVQLSELPKYEIAQTQPKPKNIQIYTSNVKATTYNQMKYGRKRNPFNDSEKAAIKKGVEMFGVGFWSRIKSHYAIILRDRNTTQIKDAFRTMKRKGEIDEDKIPAPTQK